MNPPIHPAVIQVWISNNLIVQRAPTVVHCSAGIGRSGAVMVIDMISDQLEFYQGDITIDIKKTVTHCRKHRHGMVQTIEQYKFIAKSTPPFLREDHFEFSILAIARKSKEFTRRWSKNEKHESSQFYFNKLSFKKINLFKPKSTKKLTTAPILNPLIFLPFFLLHDSYSCSPDFVKRSWEILLQLSIKKLMIYCSLLVDSE